MNSPVLVLGGSGQVGSAIVSHFVDVVAPPRSEFDLALITLDEARALIAGNGAGLVVNCAAYTHVDRAESEPELANTVNGQAVGILARATKELGARFVTFSSDYVFDGGATEPYVESSTPNPINAYGRSKLLGERFALEGNPDSLIIRTSWVISGGHDDFVSRVLRQAESGQQIQVVDDQRGSPTVVTDLVTATMGAIDSGITGILHLANQGEASWFELAAAVVTLMGRPASLVTPGHRAVTAESARRPSFSPLRSERLQIAGLPLLPPWRQSLAGILTESVQDR